MIDIFASTIFMKSRDITVKDTGYLKMLKVSIVGNYLTYNLTSYVLPQVSNLSVLGVTSWFRIALGVIIINKINFRR